MKIQLNNFHVDYNADGIEITIEDFDTIELKSKEERQAVMALLDIEEMREYSQVSCKLCNDAGCMRCFF